MMRFAMTLICTALPMSALADDRSVRAMTHDLGAVIGSEKFCELSLDQAAITTYIERNIPAEELDFPENLNMAVLGAQLYFDGMSASTKIAYCTGMRRTAKAHGLIK
jgi:cytochrome c peroxidase